MGTQADVNTSPFDAHTFIHLHAMCFLCSHPNPSSTVPDWHLITYLDLSDCTEIEEITELPPNLTHLVAPGLPTLRRISAALPGSLVELNVNGCSNLEGLPALTHTKLHTLDCGYTLVGNIPELPGTLRRLGCGAPTLSRVPSLPFELTWLGITHSPLLSTLPALPVSLISLAVVNVGVMELDLRHLTNLRRVDCSDNKLLLTMRGGYCATNVIGGNTWLQHPFNPKFRSSVAVLSKLQRRRHRVNAARRATILSQSRLLDRLAPRLGAPVVLHALLPFVINTKLIQPFKLRINREEDEEQEPTPKRARHH